MKKFCSAFLSFTLLLLSGWSSRLAAAETTLYNNSSTFRSTAPLSIVSSSLAIGTSGVYYSAGLVATGGTAPYTWTLKSGSLPAGLRLGSNGTISGTPTTGGSYSFAVTATDKSKPAGTVSGNVSITVVAAMATPLSLSASGLPSGTVGVSYGATLYGSGGTLPYKWAVTNGSLPNGLALSATGVISGTPTTSGTYTATVTLSDSGSPMQSQSATISIPVVNATAKLAIMTSALSAGRVGTAYSTSLAATGGSNPYNWTISAGNLPAGLTLTSSTGVISGTPTASGTFTLTVGVTDSASTPQSASATLSLAVAASAAQKLSVTTASLPSGTSGTAYTAALAATGGTPGYSWSIVSGALPAGVTLGSTGVISGTPSTSGTFAVTVGVTDSASTPQTATAALSLSVAAAAPSTSSATASAGTTYYVRPDGGTRYSTIMTSGQCDGKADVSYAAALAAAGGTAKPNLHCAFNDVRFLWQDGSYTTSNNNFPGYGWVLAGGDTAIIRGSLGSGVTYRVGWNNPSSSYDSATGLYWGVQGDPYSSGAPLPPAGTPTQHTRILGENYAACHTASAKTQLHGGYGVYAVLNMQGASNVDVSCLDITDFSACGNASQSNACNRTIGTLSDYATFGIIWSNTATNDTLNDIHIHGMAMAGMFGPTGDGVTMNYLDLIGNPSSGWNADPGNGTTGTGKLTVTHFNISWNGCAEEYPIVDALPYQDCTDDSSGGYGDGFGTTTVPSNPGWQATFDQGVASYNTQDGLDALHLTGAGSSMTITRTLAYGNMGQQIKVGGTSGTARNNIIVTNCNALRQAIPGTPAGYNSKLSDFCRAADSGVKLEVQPNSIVTFDFNTVYSASATAIEVDCDETMTCDSTSKIDFRNNVFVGFLNSFANGYPTTWPVTNNYANPIYNGAVSTLFTNAGSTFSNNVTYNPKSTWTCPAVGETHAICGDPGLTDERWPLYGYGTMSPASASSVVVGSGVSLPSVTTDYTGATRGLPPSIGAFN